MSVALVGKASGTTRDNAAILQAILERAHRPDRRGPVRCIDDRPQPNCSADVTHDLADFLRGETKWCESCSRPNRRFAMGPNGTPWRMLIKHGNDMILTHRAPWACIARQSGLALAFGSLALTGAWAQNADGKVKIGVLSDMSGLYADTVGAGSVEAARMAIADFGGQVLGKPIELVSASWRCDAKDGQGNRT